MRGRDSGTLFFLALALQSALKLWLVHGHEIAACDYPFDDPWYVTASTHWYWWGSYATDAFVRPPAYPLWIALSRSSGFPLRLSTELLLFAAGGVFAYALVRAHLPKAIAAIAFGLIIFHPFSVYVNDGAMADSLYAPMLLFAIAGMVAMLARPGYWQAAVWTGLCLGIVWYTRQENSLVVPQIALFAVIAAWVRAGEGISRREIVRQVGALVVILSVIVGGMVLVVRTTNYRAFGAFADRELDMPGFVAAQEALLQITQDRRVRWVGVSRQSRQRAYAVSPTFRLLEPYFEGAKGRIWEALSPPEIASEREIAGRFGWPLRAAIHWAGYGKSAADTEAFARRIADEINTACVGGQLQCAPMSLGTLALVRSSLPRIPASAATVGGLLFWSAPGFDPRCPSTVTRSFIIDVFDAAANRRVPLVSGVLRLQGWAIDFDDPVRAVSFRDPEGRVLATTNQLRARPDLDAAFRDKIEVGSGPLLAAFDLRVPFPKDHGFGGTFVFTVQSGNLIEVSYDELPAGPGAVRRKAGVGGALEYAIESRRVTHGDVGLADRALSVLLRAYGYGVVMLTLVGVAALIVLPVAGARRRGQRVAINPTEPRAQNPEPRQKPPISIGRSGLWALGSLLSPICRPSDQRTLYGVVLLLLGITGLRLMLLVVFDASAWPGNDARFLYPIAYLYPCALLLLIYGAIRTLRRPTAVLGAPAFDHLSGATSRPPSAAP